MIPANDRLRALGSRAVGVAVALAAFAVWLRVSPSLPHEHTLTLRVPDAATVTGVQLAWLPQGAPEPVHAVSWRFDEGRAPRALQTRVSLPDGTYKLEILVERDARRDDLHPTIVLGDSAEITVPLR